jgi:hypothetical protein
MSALDFEKALSHGVPMQFSVREARRLATRGWPPTADDPFTERLLALERKLSRS